MLDVGSLDNAIKLFENKFKEKSGLKWSDRLDEPKKGKYTFLERAYEESDEEGDGNGVHEIVKVNSVAPTSTLPMAVQDLMKLIFNRQMFETAMTAMSYDARKLPLGKLSKRTLASGFAKLQDLADLIVGK